MSSAAATYEVYLLPEEGRVTGFSPWKAFWLRGFVVLKSRVRAIGLRY